MGFGLVYAGVAFQTVRTYTQPDGTSFQGTVKGLAQVHWIETINGDIVKYHFDKKAYYEIDFDDAGKIIYTKEYLKKEIQRSMSIQNGEKKRNLTDKEKSLKLKKMIKKLHK